MMNFKKYFKFWWITVVSTTQTALSSRFSAGLFLLAKSMRFFLFLGLILIISNNAKVIAGYNLWQMVLFYATFNLIDTTAQFFLREVYRFRSYVVSGDFDYFLTKPISPLFRSLFAGSDVLDLPLLIGSIILIFYTVTKIGSINFFSIITYSLLILSALVIAIAFHIFVISIGVMTTEVDNTIMLYRDLTTMGRFPVDIYREPISWFITFVIPVGIMMTYPAKSLLGQLTPQLMILSPIIALTFLFLSIKFWRFSLKRYSSASS